MANNQIQKSEIASLSTVGASIAAIPRRRRIDRSPETAATQTSRLTENKRRYRARRKEYVSDIERRLAESRQHGVQATKEVQLAARQVETENVKLRQLLNLAGFDDQEIRTWLSLPGSSEESGADRSTWQACQRKAMDCAAFTRRGRDHASGQGAAAVGSASMELPSRPSAAHLSDDTFRPREDSSDKEKSSASNQDNRATLHAVSTTQCSSTQADRCCPPDSCLDSPETKQSSSETTSPCKLLSHLEQNPGVDLTQISAPASVDVGTVVQTEDGEVGVECGKAYDMLMRYATTEEKLNTIAQALEGGCRPDGGGKCAVKREVVWQVLDEMCG